MEYRIGHGFDIHRLAEGRRCVLGGVEIPSAFGPEGHSDADVLTHAICDALLGAAGLPDIGVHFPNTSPEYRNADSQQLLASVREMVEGGGWRIVNLDSTLVAEKPKIQNLVPAMKERLAITLGIPSAKIGIKATTHENIGALGRGEGISAHAVCLLMRND